MPVSYTHLDVYKRQAQLSVTQDIVLKWDLSTTVHRDVLLRWTIWSDSLQALPLSTLLVVRAEVRLIRVMYEGRMLLVN